jgi:hypothetical protein
MADVKVVFASTAYGPVWPPAASSWLAVVAYASRTLAVESKGLISGTGITDRMYTHSAENRLVHDFLDDPTNTHLFLTEADMLLPKETVTKLLDLNKPCASGVYFLRNGRGQACLYVKGFTEKANPYPHSPVSIFPEHEPFKLGPTGGCPGLGCALIAREVFEKVPYPWFDLKESNYGSDMYFWTKVRDAGYEVWIEPRVTCWQIDYTVVGIEDYHHRINTDPTFAKSGYIIGSANAVS